MRAHFLLWEQFIRPSLKAMRILLIRPIQGYGDTASLSYPDIWVRKSDCLHLPYIHPLPIPSQSPYCCPCPWVAHKCSLVIPSPSFILSPPPFPVVLSLFYVSKLLLLFIHWFIVFITFYI